MILRGGRVAFSPSLAERADIETIGSRIRAIGRRLTGNGPDLSEYLILPGLINAHDHLEFNLFPRLGEGPYNTLAEWAQDIHARCGEQIRRVLRVPLEERMIWGAIRNLASGVTTVCHHNPWHPVFDRDFPIRVMRTFSWAHSLAFSPDLARKHESCPPERPFVFHAGEATARAGRQEMEHLAELGLFARNSVLVHAVALDRKSLALVKKNGCSLVWCPSSNLFILGRTLSSQVLHSGVPTALGTDSGLSSEGDMLDEIRVARAVSDVSDDRIYAMVTIAAAQVLRLSHGEGSIREGGVADLALFKDRGSMPAETLGRQLPDAVFVRGKLQLVSEQFAGAWKDVFPELESFQALSVAGRGAVRVRCRVPVPLDGLRLAGRELNV